jgi:predicted enzyme related to lactoylglutathione lyase
MLVRSSFTCTAMPNRVAHFEIHAENPERAVEFYTKVFGWEITKWEGGQMEYWMVMTGKRDEPGGINGGLMRRRGPAPDDGAPMNGFVCTMIVDSYDDIHAKIMEHGGSVALPKMALMGMAWQGYYKDTEGNIIGIHQPDPNAK